MAEENEAHKDNASIKRFSLALPGGQIIMKGYCDIDMMIGLLLLPIYIGMDVIDKHPSLASVNSKNIRLNKTLLKKYMAQKRLNYIVDGIVARYYSKPSDRFIISYDESEEPDYERTETDDIFEEVWIYLFDNFEDFITESLLSFAMEGLRGARLKMSAEKAKSGGIIDKGEYLLHLLSIRKSALLKRLGLKSRIRKKRAELSNLLTHYEKLLPVVQYAKETYADNEKRNWKRIVKDEIFDQYEIHMPEDLILLLSGRLLDLPEDVQIKVSDKGHSSQPSEIAAEWAARLCGADDYAFAVSTLESTLRDQRSAGF